MPSFQPPLSQTSRVPSIYSSSEGDAYLSLDFFLLFQPGEDQSGDWEIWTDIPSLSGANGRPSPAIGEWHAIRFHPIKPEKRRPSKVQSSGIDPTATAITLPVPAADVDERTHHTLRANAIIKPIPSAIYSYTYRRVLPDGNVHWLGGEGSNGVIELVGGDVGPEHVAAVMAEDVKASQPGFGLVIPKERSVMRSAIEPITELHSSSFPWVLSRTVDQSTNVQLALLTNRPNPVGGAFSTVVRPSVAPSLTGSQTFTILVRSSLQPFDPTALSNIDDLLRLTADYPALVIDSAFQGVPTLSQKMQKATADILPTSATDSISVIELEQPSNSSILIWAAADEEARSVVVRARYGNTDKPTLVVNSIDTQPSYVSKTQPIRFYLPPGDTSLHLLRLFQPDELLVPNKDSLWICAPGAMHQTTMNSTSGDGGQIADILDREDSEIGHETDHEDTVSMARTDDTPELDESDPALSADVPADQSQGDEQATGLITFLKAIGHFLSGIWGWLMGSSSSPSTPKSSEAPAPTHDDEISESEAETPIDERTPLLRVSLSFSPLTRF